MKKEIVWPVVFFVIMLVIWHYVVVGFAVPKYLFPGPLDVASKLVGEYELLWKHAKMTLTEVSVGLSLGVIFGYLLSVVIVSSNLCEKVIYPYIVGSQTIPKIAIAPLLLIWLGYGILPKIVVSALASFFPVVVSTVKGMAEVDPDLLDLVKTYKASRLKTLLKVRVPNAVPSFFVGLKTAAPLSIVGAVAGEFVGSDVGLGYLVLFSQSNFDLPMAFAALVTLSIIGLMVFGAIVMIEKIFFKRYGR